MRNAFHSRFPRLARLASLTSPRSLGAGLALALAVASVGAASTARADGQGTPLPADQTGAVIGKVQAFYDQSGNFQADFTQKYVIKQYNKTKVSHGHVVFDKPGKMNWVYADPSGNWVRSDGKTLCVYEALNN